MNKCLKIVITGSFPEDFLVSFIQKYAKKMKVEGTVQFLNKESVRIIMCGPKEEIDGFLDILHKGTSTATVEDIEIEPFLKDKDYRGVFRVIE